MTRTQTILLPALSAVALTVAFAAASSCGSSATCSTEEESACTGAYTACITAAAAAASTTQCQKCVDDYCDCFDACGNSCDKSKLSGECN